MTPLRATTDPPATGLVLPMFEELIRNSTDPARLVRDARYASEKYIDPLTAQMRDQARYAAVIELCMIRLTALDYGEVVRLFRAEHATRLKLLGTIAAVDRAVERSTERPWLDDEDD